MFSHKNLTKNSDLAKLKNIFKIEQTKLYISNLQTKIMQKALLYVRPLLYLDLDFKIKDNITYARLYCALNTTKYKIPSISLGFIYKSYFFDKSLLGMHLSGYLIGLIARKVGEKFRSYVDRDSKVIFLKYLYTASDSLSRNIDQDTVKIGVGGYLFATSDPLVREYEKLSDFIELKEYV